MNRDRDSALMALMGIPFVIGGAAAALTHAAAQYVRVGLSITCAAFYNHTLGPLMQERYVPAKRVSFEDHETGSEPYVSVEPGRIKTNYRIR